MMPSPVGPQSMAWILSGLDRHWMGTLSQVVVSTSMKLPANPESISAVNRETTPDSCTVTGRVNGLERVRLVCFIVGCGAPARRWRGFSYGFGVQRTASNEVVSTASVEASVFMASPLFLLHWSWCAQAAYVQKGWSFPEGSLPLDSCCDCEAGGPDKWLGLSKVRASSWHAISVITSGLRTCQNANFSGMDMGARKVVMGAWGAGAPGTVLAGRAWDRRLRLLLRSARRCWCSPSNCPCAVIACWNSDSSAAFIVWWQSNLSRWRGWASCKCSWNKNERQKHGQKVISKQRRVE